MSAARQHGGRRHRARGRHGRGGVKLPLLLCLACLCAGAPAADAAETYRTIEWVDLIPAEDLEVLMNPPDALAAIPDGSSQDRLPGEDGTAGRYGDSDNARR